MRPIRCAVTALAAGAVALACSGDGNGAAGRDSAAVPAAVADTGAGAVPADRGTRRNVLFLGTSLTVGLGLEPDSAYPQQLQRKIDARALPYQTVNAGVSGETSAGLLRRLDWVLREPAAVIVVETGANDGLRGLPIAGTRQAIDSILARIRRERPEARVVLAQMDAPTNLGAEYTTAFHAMFPALAKRHGATLMPFLLDGVAGEVSLNQGDGIHPNLEGERKVTENVWRALEPVLVESAKALPSRGGGD